MVNFAATLPTQNRRQMVTQRCASATKYNFTLPRLIFEYSSAYRIQG